ncbi:Rha family transcriptional regulator [Clostridium estertheticum]|uniref:Rha family transcriptional regulator n=1 Tax=Clostridium estertheticum TaxID=238834 RepID=UPI001C0C2039|nr:Rha family transcriptional regulator [Clostridium estertheticum]MBU3186593.1 Rha family transcriptional regulator [Clostridium estertheticum]
MVGEQLSFELVFTSTRKMSKAIPLTRSDDIAGQCGIEHKNTKALIEKYILKFDELGREDSKTNKEPLRLKRHGKNGTSAYKVWYELNENQTNFLITLFKNTEQVVELKFKLVKEFSAMKTILQAQIMERTMGKMQRVILTDAIQDKFGNDGIKYAKFTNLCYRMLFGKTAIEIKEMVLNEELAKCTTPDEIKTVNKDIDKIVRDYFTDQELKDIKRIESECATLIRLDMDLVKAETTLRTLYPTTKYIKV